MIGYEKEEETAKLRGSLLEFTRYFYEYIMGRLFVASRLAGRESRHIICCKTLTSVMCLEILREIIICRLDAANPH